MLDGIGVEYNFIAGNYIGTDVTGTIALPNGDGVSIDGVEHNFILGNFISNNMGSGINFYSSNSIISGNHITNNTRGIQLRCSELNTISGNTLNNNNDMGIAIYDGSNNNIISKKIII